MIIESLVKYYDYLVENDNEGSVPRKGWSTAKVLGAICLNRNGEIEDIISLKQVDGKRLKPCLMIVPEQVTRSSGIKPNFLCDGPEYLLGLNTKGKDAKTRFEAAKEYHLQVLRNKETESTIVHSLILFWQKYDPEVLNGVVEKNKELLSENGNFVFQVKGQNAHTDNDVKDIWQSYLNTHSDAPIMQCLVTGKKEPIARLHFGIKGIRGAQSSGASLVSFNAPAFSSYGKEQSYNAPVSETAMFKYTTALNYLISQNKFTWFGDTTVISWAIDGSQGCENLFDMLFSEDTNEKINQDSLLKLVDNIAHGKKVIFNEYEVDPDTEFCILGISPNAARLSIRFFWKDNFGKLMRNISNHYSRLEIQRPINDNKEILSVGQILYETVNKNSNDKVASPILVGSLMNAILNDTFYPNNISISVVMRIRAERRITRGQAAILKAFLLKNKSNDLQIKEVCTVGLNSESNYEPYVLGQLFSVLEEIQSAANKEINSTIKDKYFTSAASMPAVVFPRLMQLSHVHMRKIANDGYRIKLEKKMTELYSKLPERLSTKLSLYEQESFFIGYYHQTQKRYEKNVKEE